MKREIVSVAADDVVTLAEAKDWFVVEHNLDDTLITSIIDSAVDMVQQYTGRILRLTSADYYFDSFEETFYIESYPIQSVDGISVLATVGQVSTYVGIGSIYPYQYDLLGPTPKAVKTEGFDLATIPYDKTKLNPIKIRVTEGYTTVPDALLTAIKLLAADMYRNREDTGINKLESIPNGMRFHLDAYRVAPKFHGVL